MSWENVKDAYRTRLGNPTAKEVLALVVDEANAEGLAFVGLDRVAHLTEINKRTVLRILQVFGLIGLVSRTEALLKGRLLPAFQVDLSKLGADLRADYAAAYTSVQGKAFGQRRSDVAGSVAATRKNVAATGLSVAATQPPNPLIGGPLVLLFVSPTPLSPASGGIAIDDALEQVCSALAIANRRKRRMLRDVIALEAAGAREPSEIASAMIAAWQMKAKFGHVLYPCKLERFFGDGIWKDDRQWPWDKQELREVDRRREARVGS